MEYNIYCDESCYLEHDGIDKMGFGCISVPKDSAREFAIKIRDIKKSGNCKGELKWIKASPKNIQFYHSMAELFAENDSLHFRSLIVEKKSSLNHEKFNSSSHDEFYYKMYYFLLKNILDNRKKGDTFNIYLDIKDTKSTLKIKKLEEVIHNYLKDYNSEIVLKFQVIRSEESSLLQMADFILGAVMYKSRGLNKSAAKTGIVDYLENKFGYNLAVSNEPWQQKFSLFHFMPRNASDGE